MKQSLAISAAAKLLAGLFILGALIAFAAMLLYPVCIAARIRAEEAFLLENLEGYEAYTHSVRWRLIPFVW